MSVGSGSTALTWGAGVAVGSGVAVAVGAVVAVGGTDVGTDVAVGTGVGVSASQANTRSIDDSPATAMPAMLVGTDVPLICFRELQQPMLPRCDLGGHCLEGRFGGVECFVDVVFFNPSHMTYTKDLTG